MRLQGKVAIVTGAGSGIGRATAQLFAQEGAKVVVAEYNTVTGQETADLICGAGGQAIFVRVDVSRAEQVGVLVQRTMETYGKVDILFNNAGVLAFGTVVNTEEEAWDRVMDINLKGTYLCCRAVIPHMVAAGGGVIINASSSTGAHDAAANTAAYVASKGGVTLLTRCMAIDHASQGIRVNAIAPGPTDTPMLRECMSQEALREFAASFPARRLGRPEEIAQAVLFLASEEASFVTGLVMAVDGGQTAQV